jgi:hypothetical protein
LTLALVLIACKDDRDTQSETPRDWSLAQLYDLLPVAPSAELALDTSAPGGPQAVYTLLDANRVAEPAINEPVKQLRMLSKGFDPAAEIRRLLYTQSGNGTAEYLLLVDTESNTLETLYGQLELVRIARYNGVELYRHPSLDLALGMLPGALLAVGNESTLRTLVDRLRDNPGNNDVGPAPAEHPIAFRLALPPFEDPQRALSLRQATEVSGRFKVDGGALRGTIVFDHPRAGDYITVFNQLAEGTATPPLEESGAGEIRLPIALPLQDLADRAHIRQLFQAFDGVSYAQGVGVDGNPSWLNFDVGTDPNSIFINFEFTDAEQRRRFESRELPQGFTLAPLRILQGERPGYFLVLNIYRSSGGLVEGARAEWSVFVEDPMTGEPRFLVVQAAAENISADPVNLLTFPEPVSHLLEAGEVRSSVGESPGDGSEATYFRSAFPYPARGPILRRFAREFVAANDFIYWGNGVADRGVFNGSVYARQAEMIPTGPLVLEDRSRWAQYINQEPRHALIYRNPLEIIISPWWNLEAGYLEVTPDERRALVDFSDGFYPMTALDAAEQAFRGEREVVTPATEGGDGATLYLHFRITDPQGLAEALGLSPDETLAALALTEGATREHFLTLNVFSREDSCGWQARWLAYTEVAGAASPRALRLQQQAAAPCLDADLLLHPGSQVTVAESGSQLLLSLADLDSAITASIETGLSTPQLPDIEWLASLDTVCSARGICDKRFIDGQTLNQPVLHIDPSGVDLTQLRSRWSDYIEREPLAVWAVPQQRLIVTNPWVSNGSA